MNLRGRDATVVPVPPRQGGRFRAWLPTALYIILILAAASRPLPTVLRGNQIDKLLHGTAYFLLAVLAVRSFVKSGGRWPVLSAVLLALAVGCADEWIQAMGRSRNPDRYDLLADAAGAAAGAAVVGMRRRGPRGSVDNSLSH